MNNKAQAVAETPIDRREILLRTAESLFASRGIDAVSLNEINKAAGQKNTSALHYHFGSKERLIEAIIYQEFDDIVARLDTRLDQLQAKGDYSSRDVIEAIVSPFIEKLDSERGINYLNIMVQLLDRNANMPFFDQPADVEQVRNRAFAMAEPFYVHLPAEVLTPRLIMFSTLLFRTLVTYTQFDSLEGENIMGDKQLFVSILLESLERIIFSPVDDKTLDVLSGISPNAS